MGDNNYIYPLTKTTMTTEERLAFIQAGLLRIMKHPVENLALYHAENSDEHGGYPFHLHLWCEELRDLCDEIWNGACIAVDIDHLVSPASHEVTTGWDYFRDSPRHETIYASPLDNWRALLEADKCQCVVDTVKKHIQAGTLAELLILYPLNEMA